MANLQEWKAKVKAWLEDSDREEIEVCSWGSCQYKTAKDIYDFYFEMRESGLAREEIFELLGVKATIEGKATAEEMRASFISELEDRLEESNDEEEEQEIKEAIEKIKAAGSADVMFEIEKESASDLWSAAPTIADLCYDIFLLEGVPASPGEGPILNVIEQSENYEVGLICAILVEDGLVKDEESFNGFDT